MVSELCLGTMTFGTPDSGVYASTAGVGQDMADTIIRRSLDAGINFIDTADVYSHGESERVLGQAMRNLDIVRSDVVIATKVGGSTGSGVNDRGASRSHIMDGIARSLERLQMDYVDLYQIHANDPVTPLEETVRALDDLVRQGMVRYVGVSNWQAWRIAKALGIAGYGRLSRFEAVQAYYSLAGRELEREIVPMLMEEQLGLLVWSPLARGLLSGQYAPGEEATQRKLQFPPFDEERLWPSLEAARAIALQRGCSISAVALAYVLAKPFVTSVLLGARDLTQLDENLAVLEVRLDAVELAQLDEASALRPEYPGWMLERQGRAREIDVPGEAG